jgi:hypothetical protein
MMTSLWTDYVLFIGRPENDFKSGASKFDARQWAGSWRELSRSGEIAPVEAQVVFDEGRDEVITVVVAFVAA